MANTKVIRFVSPTQILSTLILMETTHIQFRTVLSRSVTTLALYTSTMEEEVTPTSPRYRPAPVLESI